MVLSFVNHFDGKVKKMSFWN